jgi:hypothetical protein
MSRAVARDERIPLDQYFTPPDVARRCVMALDTVSLFDQPSYVAEPSVGGGAFALAVRELWPSARVLGVDLDPGSRGFDLCHEACVSDWLDVPGRASDPFDAVIGNPPYSHAEPHIRHALSVVREGGTVAFLLRLAMLEGQKRAAFWREFPPVAVHVLSRRPSFTGGGTDSAAYGFFQWRRGFRGEPRLGWI